MGYNLFSRNPFYHSVIRRSVVTFGEIFNDLMITVKDDNDSVSKVKKVPISYAAKEKWFTRMMEDPDFEQKFQIDLPRMSFEITDMQYDATRKMGQFRDYMINQCNGNNKVFAPVPWNLDISLYTYTRTQDDAFQILEQILPFFGPSLIVNINLTDDKISQDVPITLERVTRNDSFEGMMDQPRTIIQQLDFSMKLNLFGPTSNNVAVIKEVIVDINRQQDINSVPDKTYNAVVNPREAEKTDSFVIDEEWT